MLIDDEIEEREEQMARKSFQDSANLTEIKEINITRIDDRMLLILYISVSIIGFVGFGFLMRIWYISVLLLWISIVYAWVSVCYITRKPIFDIKNIQTGHIKRFLSIFFCPYLNMMLVVWKIKRMITKENTMDKICPYVYLGRYIRDKKDIENANIQLIVDVTYELPELNNITANKKYFCVPMMDGSAPRNTTQFKGVLKSMQKFRKSKTGSIYIHCAAGHGRSCMMATAFISIWYQVPVDVAFRMIKKIRPSVSMHKTQWNFVKRVVDEYNMDMQLSTKKDHVLIDVRSRKEITQS